MNNLPILIIFLLFFFVMSTFLCLYNAYLMLMNMSLIICINLNLSLFFTFISLRILNNLCSCGCESSIIFLFNNLNLSISLIILVLNVLIALLNFDYLFFCISLNISIFILMNIFLRCLSLDNLAILICNNIVHCMYDLFSILFLGMITLILMPISLLIIINPFLMDLIYNNMP